MGKAGAKAMSQGALAQALSESMELKKSVCANAVKSLAEIGTQQIKSAGKFVLPGLCMIKTRLKPATKAGKREVFGKVVMVKAKPARTVVKAFPCLSIEEGFLSIVVCDFSECSPWRKHAEHALELWAGSLCGQSLYIMRS